MDVAFANDYHAEVVNAPMRSLMVLDGNPDPTGLQAILNTCRDHGVEAYVAMPLPVGQLDAAASAQTSPTWEEVQSELSNREYEVMKLVARGLSNADIAVQLVVTVSTVKHHVSNALKKLYLKSRLEFIALVWSAGNGAQELVRRPMLSDRQPE